MNTRIDLNRGKVVCHLLHLSFLIYFTEWLRFIFLIAWDCNPAIKEKQQMRWYIWKIFYYRNNNWQMKWCRLPSFMAAYGLTLACNATFLIFTKNILVSHFYFLFIIISLSDPWTGPWSGPIQILSAPFSESTLQGSGFPLCL